MSKATIDDHAHWLDLCAGNEPSAQDAERLHNIAVLLRALSAGQAQPVPWEVIGNDDLTECFRHHVKTTIGWEAFGARPGPEMQMYEEGFKAGYRRCKSDNEPELGEEEDGLLAGARRIIRELRDYPDEVAIADAIDLIVDMHKALESRPSASIEGETP